MRAEPRLGELYPGICLTTEEKARKNLSQGSRRVLVYILPKRTRYKTHTHTHTLQNPHIRTHTLQNPHIHTHTYTPTHTHPHITKPTHIHPHITKPTHPHTHTLQNNLKQPNYKLKQTQYKMYPNETVTI